MSAFDNRDKDNLLSEIEEFLENHTLSELLEIIHYVVEWKEQESGENL